MELLFNCVWLYAEFSFCHCSWGYIYMPIASEAIHGLLCRKDQSYLPAIGRGRRGDPRNKSIWWSMWNLRQFAMVHMARGQIDKIPKVPPGESQPPSSPWVDGSVSNSIWSPPQAGDERGPTGGIIFPGLKRPLTIYGDVAKHPRGCWK